ncbi:MAG: hypothetical protein K1X55_10325 [Chitinophagales bacterium]|nr:hypothetical protein [Chitinophagales bacterium]
MRLFLVTLLLFVGIISKSQTYLELLGNLEAGSYFIGKTNPNDYIRWPNDYNCHFYYENEIKPEQIDSLENDIANKLRIYTFMPNELLIDNDSIWQDRKKRFVKRMLSFGVYNQYNKNNLFENAQYFGVNQDSNAIQNICSLYPMYFEDQLSPPFIFEFWDNNQAFKSFYDNILSANSLPYDCDTRFYNEILGKNKSTYNEWTALARTLQYEDFIFKNSNNYERLLGVLVTISEYLKNSQTTLVGKEGLYTGLGLAYFDLGNTDQEYKSYIYSLKTASYINIGNGQFVYNYFPLLHLVKSLSAYNGDFHFVNKITDLLNEKNLQFEDGHTPFLIKTSNKTYSNYEYLIVKGCFELEKLYLNPDYIEQFKLIELGIVSQLINFYNDSRKNNIFLDKFVVSLYSKAIAKYVERNYVDEQVSLYYLQYAFDLSLKSYSSSFYEQCTDEYLISLISHGYYTRAKELIDLCMVSQVTNNQFIYYCSKINLIRYYMGIEDIDSAIDVFNSFQEEIDNSYYPNDHYLKKVYYMSEIEIAERLDSTRLIAEGELGLKNAERDFTVVYNNYQKLEDEVTTELQQKNIEFINEELYRKQREIELKEVELKNKNDSIRVQDQLLSSKTIEINKINKSLNLSSLRLTKSESENSYIRGINDSLNTFTSILKDSVQNLYDSIIKYDSVLVSKKAEIAGLEVKNKWTTRFAVFAAFVAVAFAFEQKRQRNLKDLALKKEQMEREMKERKNLELEIANNKLKTETEEKIRALETKKDLEINKEKLEKELAITSNNFLKDRLNIHHSKGGLGTIALAMGNLMMKILGSNVDVEIKKETEGLFNAISLLKDYSKQCIKNSIEPLIKLSDEFENIKLYMKLYNFEKSDKPIDLEFSETIMAIKETTLFPSNILQPIVQNCIDHAFINYQNPIGNKIYIDVNENDLVIIDNGKGTSNTKEMKINKDNTGISTNDIEKYLNTLKQQKICNLVFNKEKSITLSKNGATVKLFNLIS